MRTKEKPVNSAALLATLTGTISLVLHGQKPKFSGLKRAQKGKIINI